MRTLSDIAEEYTFLEATNAIAWIELGRELEPMPDALKTDATLVRGCSASVWVYPTQLGDGRLHFLADSNAAITKGIVALVLSAVQDQPAADVAQTDIAAELAPFDLKNQLSSNRTQGLPNMIALVRETAARITAVCLHHPASLSWRRVVLRRFGADRRGHSDHADGAVLAARRVLLRPVASGMGTAPARSPPPWRPARLAGA